MDIFGTIIAKYMDYNSLKIMHLFGVIIFMGNIIITGWWKTMADKTGDYKTIAFAQRQVTLTDWVFTLGGVIILLVAAYGMVAHTNDNVMAEIYSERWLWWGFHLFVISGIIWVVILIPCQIIQARMARKFAKTGEIPDRYWFYGKVRLFFGILATIIPLANIYWMVMKS